MKVRIKNPIWGVPITFLGKYCPTQFEIVGITENADYLKPLYLDGCEKYDRPYVNGKRMYSRLLIRKKKAEPIVEVETTDNVSVNEVEQNDVQPTNNVEVAETNTNTTSNEVHTSTRRPHSDEDMYIDSITIENGTEIANKHNTRRGIKNKTINLNNSTNDIADKNLPP